MRASLAAVALPFAVEDPMEGEWAAVSVRTCPTSMSPGTVESCAA